jgi:hypothetical protein
VPLPAVQVSDIELGDQDLRFTVDQIGVPVLVKMSYFPNWKVTGADGPYRVAPNFMVVVPTSTDVHLTYGRTSIDYVAYLLTLLGVVMLVVMRRRGDPQYVTESPIVEPVAVVTDDTRNDLQRDLLDDPTPTGAIWERPPEG